MTELIGAEKGFAVIYKKYGSLCEGGDNSVTAELAALLENKGIKYTEIYCVHRLDRTTEGLMVYATEKKTAASLSSAIQEGKLHKTYRAYITASDDIAQCGEMRDYLYFDRRADKSFVCSKEKKDAKEAILTYSLGERYTYDGNEITAADVELVTGRSHQIRVQFASRRSPLVGDGKYGSRIKYHGPALFSYILSFELAGREYRYEVTPPEPFEHITGK